MVVLYRARLAGFLASALSARSMGERGFFAHPVSLIGIAFLCTAIPAFLLKKVIGKNLENLNVMVAAMFVGGIVMLAVEWLVKKPSTHTVEAMRPWQAAFIGLVQVTSAVFPGTSRSMSTIASAQLAGLSRPVALEFSFLVSIPIMIVATLYDLFKYIKETKAAGLAVGLDLHQSLVLAVGFVVSFVVAYAVIAWFLSYVQKHGFWPFAVYRLIMAGLLYFLLQQ